MKNLTFPLVVAALSFLAACKAVPKGARAAEAPSAAPVAAESAARHATVVVTGYCSCPKCCGPKARGITASGSRARHGSVAADPSVFPFGMQMTIPGYGIGTVEDTGKSVKGYRLDLWFPTHAEARAWGRREMSIVMP